MAKFLRLVNGIPKMQEESGGVAIYDESIEIKVSGASGDNELNGPITAGTPVTLPLRKTYTSDELEVYLNGDRLTNIFDYAHNSTTTVTFTFELIAGDLLRFRIDRTS